MITKTAGEVLNAAQVKAQVYNIDFLDWHTATNELNNAYRQLYTEIAESDADYYIKELTIQENEFNLPEDCFLVKLVCFINTDGSWTPIQRQPNKEYIKGYYYIENNIFHYNGYPNRPILIKYVPIPQTITVPREMEDIDIPAPTEFGKQTDRGFFFKVEDTCYYYSFDNASYEQIQEDEYKPIQDTYLRKKVNINYDEQTVYLDDEDYTDVFIDDNFGEFVNIVFDTPYFMVTYADGHIMVGNYFNKTLWNPNAKTGHETYGIIHSLKTDDTTLWGCIYEDEDGNYYRASFVPDTVMNYPSNALFNYLEVILAKLFLSINNISNQYIESELFEQTKHQFYKELIQNRSNTTQINNIYRRKHEF